MLILLQNCIFFFSREEQLVDKSAPWPPNPRKKIYPQGTGTNFILQTPIGLTPGSAEPLYVNAFQ